MATFFNQATLSYGNNVTTSNVTTGELISGLTLTKTAASVGYKVGENVVYVISLTNSTTTDRTGITLTDNLGVYDVAGTSVVPLSYVKGSVLYYKDGVLQPAPTVTVGTTLVISGITVPAGGNATVVYNTTANSFAPAEVGSTITNIVATEDLTASTTIAVSEETRLTISKAICPPIVNNDGQLTYTFIIQNTGNLAADTKDLVTVTDVFNPVLNGITVTLDGVTLEETTGYTYNTVTGEFATVPGIITVPPATYFRNPDTGVITTTPGVAVLTITGIV